MSTNQDKKENNLSEFVALLLQEDLPKNFSLTKLQELEANAKNNDNYLLENEVQDFLKAEGIDCSLEAYDCIVGYLEKQGVTIVYPLEDDSDSPVVLTDRKDNTHHKSISLEEKWRHSFVPLSERVKRRSDLLTDRERAVLELRFGLKDRKFRTLKEAGQILGITGERVRQIQAKALTKIRIIY